MARPLKLEIQETPAELRMLLERQTTPQAKERVQALYLLKEGQVNTVTSLANTMGRHRVTLQKWLKVYRHKGINGLIVKRQRGGKRSTVPPWAIDALRERLSQPDPFHSYTEIQDWIRKDLGCEVSYRVVYGLVHDKLKFKVGDAGVIGTQDNFLLAYNSIKEN